MKNRLANLSKFCTIFFIVLSFKAFSQDHSMHIDKKAEVKNDDTGKISFGGKTVRYNL